MRSGGEINQLLREMDSYEASVAWWNAVGHNIAFVSELNS